MENILIWSGELFGFLFKALVTLFVILMIIKALTKGLKSDDPDGLKVTHLNEELKEQKKWLHRMLLTPEARELAEKAESKSQKGEKKSRRKEAKRALKAQRAESEAAEEDEAVTSRPRLFVLQFKGDIQASAIDRLREEITAIIQVKEEGDEVLLCLENSGGYVHTHGLAASQLTRLRAAGFQLTIAIDKVAASGGYMMACVGQKIIAAPFAIVGSIGVVAQLPNINKLLKRYDVDVELHTAGEYKRTLTVIGENTDAGRAKFKEELEKTHGLFQDFVHAQRPQLDVTAVATGETWYGQSAVEIGLVDAVMTSDELILNSVEEYEVYRIEYLKRRKVKERALTWLHTLLQGRLPEA